MHVPSCVVLENIADQAPGRQNEGKKRQGRDHNGTDDEPTTFWRADEGYRQEEDRIQLRHHPQPEPSSGAGPRASRSSLHSPERRHGGDEVEPQVDEWSDQGIATTQIHGPSEDPWRFAIRTRPISPSASIKSMRPIKDVR